MKLAPHPVTLRQLQYVVAVADRSSFRRAAEDCRVAQPSLSAQIAQCEDVLGVRLFDRDHRRVTPTPAGEALIAEARALLEQADRWVERARSFADPLGGVLRLGVIPTIGPYLLPEVAPHLRARFPRLSFVWSEDKTAKLVKALERGELDGAILALEAEVGDLEARVLGKDTFWLAAAPGHPLASSTAPLPARELDGETVLVLDDGHCFGDQALDVCARRGAEPSAYRGTSLQTLVQLAAGGAGVTLLPRLALELENRKGALKVRPFEPEAPGRTLALVWRRGTGVEPRLAAVGEALVEAYARLTTGV